MACSKRNRLPPRAAARAAHNSACLHPARPFLFCILLLALPSSSQHPSTVSAQPAASIVESWGVGAGMHGNAMDVDSRGSSSAHMGEDAASRLPADSAWADGVTSSASQETVDSRVKNVLQTAASVKPGPSDDGAALHGPEVRGRGGQHAVSSSGEATQEKSADATTYIVTKNGRVYLSEKPVKAPAVVAEKSHAQKMMSMAHAKMDAIAKKDKRFADQLKTEAKQLKAAGMAAEGQALEREAADLLSKLKKMIKNKHKAEQDKASINQRVAEVDRRLSKMKLHGSVVPHKKDIDELRDTSKKEVRKAVMHEDQPIYEYRNGTVWWSRESNSSILNASAAADQSLDVDKAGSAKESPHRFRFINRPDSVVMNARRHREQTEARLKVKKTDASAKARADGTGTPPLATAASSAVPQRSHPQASKAESGAQGAAEGKGGADLSQQMGSGHGQAPASVREVGGGAKQGETEASSQAAGSKPMSETRQVAATAGGRDGRAAGSSPSSGGGGPSGAHPGGGSDALAAADFGADRKRAGGKQGAPAAGTSGARATRQAQGTQGRETALQGPEGGHGKRATSLSLDIIGGIVAVLVLVVAAVYIKRLFFAGPNAASEAMPAYTSLEGGGGG